MKKNECLEVLVFQVGNIIFDPISNESVYF